MKWVQTPPEIVATFGAASLGDPRVVRKPMFGYPALCALTLAKERLGLLLPPAAPLSLVDD